LSNIEIASFLRWYLVVELHGPEYARRYFCTYDMLENNMMKVCFLNFCSIPLFPQFPACIECLRQLVGREDGDEDGFRLWQSLSRQNELTAQLCSIMKEIRNVRGSAQKKIDKLRQLLSGSGNFCELTNFDEV
jgi:phosphatidylinositol 3-kinase